MQIGFKQVPTAAACFTSVLCNIRPPAIATIRLEATAPTAMPGQAQSARETAAAATVAFAWWSLQKQAAANIIKAILVGNYYRGLLSYKKLGTSKIVWVTIQAPNFTFRKLRSL